MKALPVNLASKLHVYVDVFESCDRLNAMLLCQQQLMVPSGANSRSIMLS